MEILQISSKTKNISMRNQQQPTQHFIGRLFDNLISTKSGGSEHQICFSNVEITQDETFFTEFRHSLQICKGNMRNLCHMTKQIEQMTARKIINTLMYLSKDVPFLLEEGVMSLYMDLVEMKEKNSKQSEFQARKLLQSCIVQVQPLLYEFFVYREYRKLRKNCVGKRSKVHRTLSLVKKHSLGSQESTQERAHSSTQLSNIDEEQIHFRRSAIKQQSVNQLLSIYLSQCEMELNQLEEVCKICSKNIKINHLQKHVKYCQKKYVIKQEIATLQKQILSEVNQLIVNQRLNSLKDSQIAQNLNQIHIEDHQEEISIEDGNNVRQNQYIEVLYEITNIHKIGSYKGQTLKKIQPRARIRQNVEKYEEIILMMESYLNLSNQKQEFSSNITHFLSIQRQILYLTNQLRTVELQHENLKEIVSSSTLRPSSRSSTTKLSEKKSRFAGTCISQKSSKQIEINSRDEAVDSKDGEFIQLQTFAFQSQKNINVCDNDENFSEVQSISKQSLENEKIVHLNKDSKEESIEKDMRYSQKIERRKSRKIKSLVMFDNSDSEQEENQYNSNQCRITKQLSQSSDESESNIGIQNFEILKYIGKGAFGKVYAVRKKNSCDLYALKMIDIGEDWGSEEYGQLANQHEIFKKVAGEHLVQAPYCFSQGSIHVFIMEFMPGGDLGKVLEEEVYLEQERARLVLAQIVLAIEHLHKTQIIHRDLKPENLVIDERGHLKLTDFGLSEIKIQSKLNTIKQKTLVKDKRHNRRTAILLKKQNVRLIGTPDYIAPQIINGISLNNKSIDWWSLGVMAYEIMIGVRPFTANTITQVIDNILRQEIEWPEIGNGEGMITQKSYDFIKRLLDKDFINRLGGDGVEEIKAHPFFTGIDWQTIKQQPGCILPNYGKIKELLEMDEDVELRKEIEMKVEKKVRNCQIPQLDNFIRFDILGEKTVTSAKKVKSDKTITLRRLKSIKNIIDDKENQAVLEETLQIRDGCQITSVQKNK